MSRILVVGASAVLCLAGLSNAADVRISGMIVDRAGIGLSGANVSFGGLSATSSGNGAWALSGVPSGTFRQHPTQSRSWWTGRAVEVDLSSPSLVSVDAFDLRGALRSRIANLVLEAGRHSIPLPPMETGIVKLRVRVDGRSEFLLAGNGVRGRSILPIASAARSNAVLDTLRVAWGPKVVASIPMTNLDTSGIVVNVDTSGWIPWNDTVKTYGSLYDRRDGRVYRTVGIGKQVWMAENLNFQVDGSWWYKGCDYWRTGSCDSLDENVRHGAKYGRLYKWTALMNLPDSCGTKYCLTPDTCQPKGSGCAASSFPRQAGVCPFGWHVPSDTEWTILIETVRKDPRVTEKDYARALKSTAGWEYDSKFSGLDLFGFRALPSGRRVEKQGIQYGGAQGYWWSATEMYTKEDVWYRSMEYTLGWIPTYVSTKDYGFACRCVRD